LFFEDVILFGLDRGKIGSDLVHDRLAAPRRDDGRGPGLVARPGAVDCLRKFAELRGHKDSKLRNLALSDRACPGYISKPIEPRKRVAPPRFIRRQIFRPVDDQKAALARLSVLKRREQPLNFHANVLGVSPETVARCPLGVGLETPEQKAYR